MRLRRVVDADALAFFRWWSDRESRRFSGGGAPVSWDAHLAWFAENIRNPYWLVGVVDPDARNVDSSAISVGACRVELGDDLKNWISIVLDPMQRGNGYGKTLIALATAEFQRQQIDSQSRVWARIHRWNVASRRAFMAAGYATNATAADERNSVWLTYYKD